MASVEKRTESEAEAFGIVQKLEDQGALGSGGRLPALLRYLLGEELAGRGERLRAYAIATEVLGRGKNFNPAEDAIVRVEIGRLRRALDYYYAKEGRNETLRIVIPRGGLRPRIERVETDALFEPDSKVYRLNRMMRRQRDRIWYLFLLSGIGLILSSALAFKLGSEVTQRRELAAMHRPLYAQTVPRLVLLPVEAQDFGSRLLAIGLRAQMASMLARQIWLNVSIEDDFSPSEPVTDRTFLLSTVLQNGPEGYTLRALLYQGTSRKVVWTGQYFGKFLHEATLALSRGIVSDVASDLGYSPGPVGPELAPAKSVDEPEEAAAQAEDRFLCLMSAHRYWRGLEVQQRLEALTCLERLTPNWPEPAEPRAMLALFALEDARSAHNEQRENALARAEILLSHPQRFDRLSLIARLNLAACRGTAVSAQADAEALFNLAPNDPEALVEIGKVMGMSALNWQLALSAEDRALDLLSMPHPRFAHVRAAHYVLGGQYDDALAALSLKSPSRLPPGETMLLTLATLADAPLLAMSGSDRPSEVLANNPQRLFANIDAACWDASIKQKFRDALNRALALRAQR